LDQLANINGGFAFKSTDYKETGTRIVRISDFDEFGFKDHKVVRHPFSPELKKFALDVGDILMAMTGGTVGKSFYVRSLPEPMLVNQRVATIKVLPEAESSYINVLIRSEFTQKVIRNAKNSTNDNISMADIKGFAVPLPPLAEQKRIVAKVDELMALCDRLEAQQQERETRHTALARASLAHFAGAPTVANLELLFHSCYTITPADLRKSILSLAVQGKLVEQDLSDEPVEELLKLIFSDRNTQEKSSRRKQSPMKDDGVKYEIPTSWSWSNVQELAQPNESVTYGILKPVWMDLGVPTVRVTEMKTGIIDVPVLPRCAPERAAKFSKTTLREGDLLISKDGTIGKTAFVPSELDGGNITQHILRFAISKRLHPEFVRLCIDAPPCQGWMAGETKGVALQGVNVGDFRRMPIPLPPLAEQHRIVAKVDQLMALVDQLEVQLAASKATATKLMEAVVAELTTAPIDAH